MNALTELLDTWIGNMEYNMRQLYPEFLDSRDHIDEMLTPKDPEHVKWYDLGRYYMAQEIRRELDDG